MNRPVVKDTWCKGCAMCADGCPKGVFDIEYLGATSKVSRPGDCVACGLCELKCPDFAVTVMKAEVSSR